MHEKDRKKIMEAGFILYRCSEIELVVKRRSANDLSWKVFGRYTTKKAIKAQRRRLLDHPQVIQD